MIYINDIPSFRDPEHYTITPDDRVEKIDLINGVVVQDFGHITGGDTFALECLFTMDNFNRFVDLWERRQKVSFTDTGGITWQGLRIVLKSFERDRNFPEYVMTTFELWRA